MQKSKVLCIPGWNEGCNVFENIKNYLKDYLEFVYIELPGFNSNLPPNKPFSPLDYAKYIKDKNINFDYILAHSYGGKVAIEYYLNFEKKKLILLGPSIIKPHKSIWIKFKILIYKLRKKYNLLNNNKTYGSVDYQNAKGVMKETFRIAINTYYDNKLNEIKDNVLLIYGKYDKKTPPREGRKANKLLTTSKFEIINCDHFMMISNADSVSKLIYKFVRNNQ